MMRRTDRVRTRCKLLCFLLPVIFLLGYSTPLPVRGEGEKVVLPKALTDIDGKRVDIEGLARDKKLVFVTLKATWCPVCANQLVRLKKFLPRLKLCRATFVVLSPGPRDALAAVKKETGFPYPFVEDRELRLARRLRLALGPNQIQPAIFAVNKTREMVWMQYGRSGVYYGDKALLKYLGCEREFDMTAL